MRLGCQVVDRVTSRDTPGLNLLSERHGAMILKLGPSPQPPSVGLMARYTLKHNGLCVIALSGR